MGGECGDGKAGVGFCGKFGLRVKARGVMGVWCVYVYIYSLSFLVGFFGGVPVFVEALAFGRDI